jgi:hypothetical protein
MNENKTRAVQASPKTIIERIQGRLDWVNGNDSV